MADIRTSEPSAITLGTTVKWTRSFADYLPVDGWVLTYNIRGTNNINLIAAASGDLHAVTVTKATSQDWQTGRNWWHAFVDDTVERFLVDRGEFNFKPDISTVCASFDGRSESEIILDAINAVINKIANKSQESYKVQGLELVYRSIEELIVLRDKYEIIVTQERRTEDIRKGKGTRRKVFMRLNGL